MKHSQELRKNLPLAYTKIQLIKKLKEDNNYNVEFINDLSPEDEYIWKRDTMYDLRNYIGDKAYDTKYYKIRAMLNEILYVLAPQKDNTAKRKAFNYIERYLNTEDNDAVMTMIVEGSKDLTADEIYNIEMSTLKYEIKGEEYISISVQASVWTYYIKGSFETQGKVIEVASVIYDSETNRL